MSDKISLIMEPNFKDAILFDLDGTLWDATSNICESWNKAMINNHLKYRFTLNDIKSHMGLTPIETVKIAFNDVDIDTGLNYFKMCVNQEIIDLNNKPGKMYQDEIEVLNLLRSKYPLFIVSNSDKGYIESYLNSLKMHEYFIDHICAGDTSLEKWENILYIKNKYQIDNIIYVGDTLKDYLESSKAKVNFIHASYGFGKINEDVYKINSLKELVPLVDKIFKNN